MTLYQLFNPFVFLKRGDAVENFERSPLALQGLSPGKLAFGISKHLSVHIAENGYPGLFRGR